MASVPSHIKTAMHLEELQRLLACSEEMQRMFLNAGLIQADTLPVPGTSMADMDWAAFDAYYRKRFGQPCPEAEHTASLTSLGLLKNQQLTLAGVLLFGLQPQRWLPVCMVKAVAFYGNSIGDTQYQDSEDIDGTLSAQFQRSFAFLTSSPTLAFGHRLRGKEGDSYGATHEKPRA